MAKKNEYADRAKIFIPFDTLKGFREALREKEKVKVPKRIISNEIKEMISNTLKLVRKGKMVKAIYYSDGEYISIQGITSNIDFVYQSITIVKEKIEFNDLLEISIVE